jgi:uncharacterized damage-inducible protein DinB
MSDTQTLASEFLQVVREQFAGQKQLADRALAQLSDADYHVAIDPESNSIATIMKHIAGNAISRWTDFLTTDGEKPDRNRDSEFIDEFTSTAELTAYWNRGWDCVFNAIDGLTEDDLLRTVYIRGEAHTVIKAINRQTSHYGYHVGQIVFLAKHLKSEDWKTLSIPKGKSEAYNQKKMA